MSKNEKQQKNLDLTGVVTTAIQIPGVKVSRDTFLRDQFKDLPLNELSIILEKGPVEAGCPRALLQRKASKIIKERTALSTGASFLAGIPGGIAMAATIPADLLQFYGVALRMAQELVYLYGEADLWCEGAPDPDKVTNQLILYCGVMLGVSGAAQTIRLMSSALAKQALKKLPQMALTKTFYYPIIKSIVKFFGVSLTKSTFAKGVSKIIPVVGGVVSGGITLASMLPMGNRLAKTLDEAHFDYSSADFEADWKDVSAMQEEPIVLEPPKNEAKEPSSIAAEQTQLAEDPFEKIKKAKQMLDMGVITEKEYEEIKARLISQM
jgi:hypothetical protein